MPPTLAAVFALALYALALLPLAAAYRLSAGRTIVMLYVALILCLGVYHTGIFHRGSLARTDNPGRTMGIGKDDPRCVQVLEVLASSGLDIAASDADESLQNTPGWNQLPEEGRGLVLECVRSSAGAPNRGG